MKKQWLLLPVAVLFFCGIALFFGCPIRSVSGIPCPGCGLTRAWAHALQGDFAGASALHPLFFMPVPLLLGCVFYALSGRFIHKKTVERVSLVVLIGSAALLLLVYVLRLKAGTIV